MSKNDSTTDTSTETTEVPVSDVVETKMRVVIERHPNPDVTNYHVNHRFTEHSRDLCITRSSSGLIFEDRYSELGNNSYEVEPLVQSLTEKILDIPGILNFGPYGTGGVFLSTYELTVYKGTAFVAEEIELAVLGAIAESFDLTLRELDVTVKDGSSIVSRGWVVDEAIERDFGLE